MLCTCPNSQSLSTIPEQMCDESFGQIQKVAFQRLVDSEDGSRNGFSSIDNLKSRLQWATFMVHYGDKRLVISPYIQAPTSEGGDARTFGGGNETLDGAVEILGANPTTFSGVLRSIPQTIIKMMKEFECEEAIGVYLIDNKGQIGCIEEDGAYYPIPIHSLFISDLVLGGYDAPDSNTVTWKFKDGWSDNLAIVSLGWNALSDAPKVEVKEVAGTPYTAIQLSIISADENTVGGETIDIDYSLFSGNYNWLQFPENITDDSTLKTNGHLCGMTQDMFTVIEWYATINGFSSQGGKQLSYEISDCLFVDGEESYGLYDKDVLTALMQTQTEHKVYCIFGTTEADWIVGDQYSPTKVFYPLNFESKTHYLELTNEFGEDFPRNTPPTKVTASGGTWADESTSEVVGTGLLFNVPISFGNYRVSALFVSGLPANAEFLQPIGVGVANGAIKLSSDGAWLSDEDLLADEDGGYITEYEVYDNIDSWTKLGYFGPDMIYHSV